MNSRELIRNTLAGCHRLFGTNTPRIPCGPLAVHVTAALAGVAIEEYTLKPDAMVDCICRYHDRFEPDAVWLSADTWITAEAMGAHVAFPGKNQPMSGTGEALIRTAGDIDAIPSADPSSQGRMPLMLEAMEKLRRRLGDEVFIVACFDQSPFSLACALGGMDRMMMNVILEPEFVEAVMERCIEYASAYASALGKMGADLLSTGDSPAGLLGVDHYRALALPAEQRVFQKVEEACGIPTSLYICGNAEHLLEDMAASGAHVLELDHLVDLQTACDRIPDTIALWGNLDPVGVIEQGPLDRIVQKVREVIEVIRSCGRDRFVLSSGCTMTPETPAPHIEALCTNTW